MTFDSLIAVVALAIAAYQIMPRSRQLDLGLRFRLPARVAVVLGSVSILYLQFYPSFKAVGLTPELGLARVGLTPYNVSFIVFLATAIFVVWRLVNYRLKPRHARGFRMLVNELLSAREWGQLAHVLDVHGSTLIEIAPGPGNAPIIDWLAGRGRSEFAASAR